jgi:hypothetical protein
MTKYPSDVHMADARVRIAQLQDDQAWNVAQVASSVQGYQHYLSVEPNGSHAQVARDEIKTRERAIAWQALQGHANRASLQAFLQTYPSGDEAAQARNALEKLAAYRAELATSFSEKAADRKRAEIAKRFGHLVSTIVVIPPGAIHHEYRILSSPMSEQDANTVCANFEKQRQNCEVVQATG